MPGRGEFGEVSSASNCTDYQTRRLNIRYRHNQSDNTKQTTNSFLHSLNGTGLAVPRVMIALLETHQREDGSVVIPEPLRPYMGGASALVPLEKS